MRRPHPAEFQQRPKSITGTSATHKATAAAGPELALLAKQLQPLQRSRKYRGEGLSSDGSGKNANLDCRAARPDCRPRRTSRAIRVPITNRVHRPGNGSA